VLFVGQINGDISEELRRRIDRQLLAAFNRAHPTGQPAAERYFDEANSAAAMREMRATDSRRLEEIAALMGAWKLDDAGKKLAFVRGPPTHLLRVEADRDAAGSLLVRLELYTWPKADLTRVKAVGGCAATDEEVMAQLDAAAGSLRNTKDTLPHPLITVSGEKTDAVGVGSEVVLDGCRSHDAEYDALLMTWEQIVPEGNDAIRIISKQGFPGARLRFTPVREGAYKLVLHARQEAGGTGFQRSPDTVVRVYRKPRPDAGESAVVTWSPAGETLIELDAGRSEPKPGAEDVSFIWRQVGGPSAVTFGSAAARVCGESRCVARTRAQGLYTFQVEVRNGPLRQTAEVRYLVAARPTADVTYCEPRKRAQSDGRCHIRTAPNRLIELRAQARSDDIDPEPIIYWRRMENNLTGMLIDPYSATPKFVASELGNYEIDVHVRGRRKVGDREMWEVGVTPVVVDVRRPRNIYFLSAMLEITHGKSRPPMAVSPTFGYYRIWEADDPGDKNLACGMRLTAFLGQFAFSAPKGGSYAHLDLGGSADFALSIPRSDSFNLAPFQGWHVAYRDRERWEFGPELGLQFSFSPLWSFGTHLSVAYRLVWSYEPGSSAPLSRSPAYGSIQVGTGYGLRIL
jgi:hypothetical protein